MKIFITGGIGYLGSCVVNSLIQNDQVSQVLVYDNFNQASGVYSTLKLSHPKLKFVEGDLLDRRRIKKEIKGFDSVVHLGIQSFSANNDVDTHRLEQFNHWATAELIDIAEDTGIKRFVLGSSSSVYGETQAGKPAKEEFDLIATNPVAQSIIRAEKHAFRFLGNQKIKMYVLRMADVYGLSPNTDFGNNINRWLLYSKLVNKITLYGEGNHVHSYVSVKQATEVILKSLLEDHPEGIYNLSDVQTSLLDLLDVLKELNPNLEFVFVNHHLHLPNLEISSELAQETFKIKNLDLHKQLSEMWSQLG